MESTVIKTKDQKGETVYVIPATPSIEVNTLEIEEKIRNYENSTLKEQNARNVYSPYSVKEAKIFRTLEEVNSFFDKNIKIGE